MNRFRNVETRDSLRSLEALGLLSAAEVLQLTDLADDPALDPCLAQAETVHVHVKVEDTGSLPARALAAAGATLDHGREGFVKYRLPGGLNAIFSHIPVSADDLAESASARRRRPFLDHIGVDMRSTGTASRAAFESVPKAGGCAPMEDRSPGRRERAGPLLPCGGGGKALALPDRAGSAPDRVRIRAAQAERVGLWLRPAAGRGADGEGLLRGTRERGIASLDRARPRLAPPSP
jgi:hypothetical protein